jgi:2-phosphoglycerate kinase
MSPGWTVLVLLGASGTGKSTAATEIARRTGATWMQVDDLRLALQYSLVVLPEHTGHLYAFVDDADVWSRPMDELRRAFVDVAEVMVPAVRVVIDSHVVTNVPMVIEGDGILPALFDDPVLRPHIDAGLIRFCSVAADDPGELLENMLTRGRGIDTDRANLARQRAQVAANEAFGAWLAEQSRRRGIPVVSSRPFDSLVERILKAIDAIP